MDTKNDDFEVIISIDGDQEHAAAVAERVRAVIEAEAQPQDEIAVEHWQPYPVRGVITRAFFTSVGIATVTRSSLSRIASVLDEVATALDGTSDGEIVTVQIGKETIALADVTREMIESWLPPEG